MKQPMQSTQHPSWHPAGIFLTAQDDVACRKHSFADVSFPLLGQLLRSLRSPYSKFPFLGCFLCHARQSWQQYWKWPPLHPSSLRSPPCWPRHGAWGWRRYTECGQCPLGSMWLPGLWSLHYAEA